MKNKQAFTAAILWIFALSIAGIFLIFTSEKESRISDAENRMLQGFPELSVKTVFNDEFTTQFEAFLSDSFFERDRVISFTSGLLDSFSMLSKDDEIRIQSEEMEKDLQGVGQFSDEEEPSDEDATENSSDTEPVSEEEDDEEEPSEKITVAPGEILITDKNSYLWYEHTDGTVTRQYTYNLSDIVTYAQTLKIMQTYLPEDGNILFTQIPLAAALRGAGDTVFPLIASAAGIWTFRVFVAPVFVNVLGWGLVGAWLSIVLDQGTRAAVNYWRFSTGKWMNRKSI